MRHAHRAVAIAFCSVVVVPTLGAQAAHRAEASPRLEAIRLPARDSADRFYVQPVTEGGDTLLLYTDTGGGDCFLLAETVRRLGLSPEWVRHRSPVMNVDSVQVVGLPALAASATIPLPATDPPIGGRFLVIPQIRFGRDGLLGRTWFAGRVWVLDYPGKSLSIVSADSAASLQRSAQHRAPLGFQTDSLGQRTTNFPRISVEVDGDSIDLLFDTGATVFLTDSALAQLHDGGPVERATSFITREVFERWHARHPDWRVVPGAEQTGNATAPMIEVPGVTVAGLTVGPVWFTVRADRNFHEYMSRWMDRRVEGALGGSALKYFRVTLDYVNAVASFERP